MSWGVYPILISRPEVGKDWNLREELVKACKVACDRGFCNPESDLMTCTAGLPFGVSGNTNVIRVVAAAGPDYWYNENGNGQMKFFEAETLI